MRVLGEVYNQQVQSLCGGQVTGGVQSRQDVQQARERALKLVQRALLSCGCCSPATGGRGWVRGCGVRAIAVSE